MLLNDVTELKELLREPQSLSLSFDATHLLSADKSTDGNGVGVSECERSCTNFPVTFGGAKQCSGCHAVEPFRGEIC
jgi:hypothetical protein